MGFSAKKSSKTMSEINVTPFVDVMLVLLIMFMVATPLMQQGIEVELPSTKASGSEATDEPFVIAIKKDKRIYLAKTEVGMKDVEKKLKAIFKTRKNKQVYLQADQNVPYGVVAEVMGEIRSAGIYNIGLITLPKTKL